MKKDIKINMKKRLFTRKEMEGYGTVIQAETEMRIIDIIKKWGKHNDGADNLIEMIQKE